MENRNQQKQQKRFYPLNDPEITILRNSSDHLIQPPREEAIQLMWSRTWPSCGRKSSEEETGRTGY